MLKKEIPSLYLQTISGGCNGNPFPLPATKIPADDSVHILPYPMPLPMPIPMPELEPVDPK